MKKTITIKHTGIGGDIRVRADSEHTVRDAANILARRMWGRRGTVVTLRIDSMSADGSSTWEAFIGREPTASEFRKYGPGVSGNNVWIYA